MALSSDALAAVSGGNVSILQGLKIMLSDGNHYFVRDGDYLTFDGHTYGPVPYATISDLATSSGVPADKLTITLDAGLVQVPPDYVDSVSWFQSFLGYDLQNRRVDHSEFIIDPETSDVLHQERVFAGEIDKVEIVFAPGRSAVLNIEVLSYRIRLQKGTARVRSDQDQKRLFTADGSFRHASDEVFAGGKFPWGYTNSGSGGYSRGRGGVDVNLRPGVQPY